MKKVTAALTVLLALTLTGCAGSGNEAGDESTAPIVSESAAPLVAESPAAANGSAEADAAFLAAFREIQATYATAIPDATDQQLLDAGHEACDRLASGEESTDISLIEGEERNSQSEMYLDSVTIVGAASTHLCQ